MMHPLGLQICLWPCVTFDLVTPKVDGFMPLSCGPLAKFIKHNQNYYLKT